MFFHMPSKLMTRVRFPSPAPIKARISAIGVVPAQCWDDHGTTVAAVALGGAVFGAFGAGAVWIRSGVSRTLTLTSLPSLSGAAKCTVAPCDAGDR